MQVFKNLEILKTLMQKHSQKISKNVTLTSRIGLDKI